MDKLFEKIGDHFNNPEMSDRILVVKIRRDGWEKLEAAHRVRIITKTNSQEGNDSISVTNFNKKEKMHLSTDRESIIGTSEPKCDTESARLCDDSFNSTSELRTVSSLSCDSGISDATFSETKRTVKSKKIEESSAGGEKGNNPVNEYSGNWQGFANLNGDAVVSSTSSDVLIADISYAQKIGAIGLTALDSDDGSASASAPSPSTNTETAETSEEDLTFTDTVIREQQLYVHSFWLALNSSYFRGLFFSSGMKETKVKKVEMNISESLSSMFLLLIESLYKPEVVMTESVENLLVLMRLAHVYDAESTLKACQKLLGSAELTVEICDKSLNMQEHERLPEMAEFIRRCEEFLVEEFSPLDSQWSSEDFLSLSPNGLQKENTVFLALMKWAEVNEVFDDQLEPLLELVRFKAMTINYLHDVVTSDHPIASTVAKFQLMFEEAVFYHAFSKERQCEEGEPIARKAHDDPVVFNWTVDIGEDIEVEKKKKIIKSPHFWVSGYEMFLELKLRTSGCQGLYLTISTRDFRHSSKGFVKLAYSLTSNFPKATRVINEADVFDREGSGWGYEEFFPLSWTEFKDQLKRTPLIITSQVSLLE
ncbi:uncharacterized protein LOC111324413 isoform X2 [Stylophora pistillata]|uniref:uncharacterized protein LOC111324413 isoform X2 n=1 Tax=Stylophora pistillata TaxID=50429 RepID=UPI000C0461D3|nr:uncharacterized protein LOC111324413 isoform X2 [Stylophora pistillata]